MTSTHARDLPTVCVLCSHNCGLRVDVADGRIVVVRPDQDNPITRGYACQKSASIPHYVDHAQRVEHPLRRRADGTFERVSWDVAIAEIGQKLRALRAQHPARALAFAGIGGQANHLSGLFALGLMRGLGSRAWFNSLAQEKTQHALLDRWMFAAPPTVFLHPDTDHTRYLIMLGTNPAVSHRGHNAKELLAELRRDETRTLVVVEPRRTETARRADEHVALEPGSDAFFLLGLCAVIVRERLWDRDFLAARAREVEPLAALLAEIDPAAMAARAKIDVAQLERIARGFAAAESAGVQMDLGTEQTRFSTLSAYLARVLVTLTGNLGRRGGNVFYGTFAAELPPIDRAPFRALVSGIEAIEMLAPFGMLSPNLLPEEILAADPARVRALIVEGMNPLVQAADLPRQREAFAALELLVVIDPAMTETARAAHYVLPPPVGYEKWEHSTFPKRYPEIFAQVRPPVVAPPADTLPEAEIYARLARAAGLVGPAPRALRLLARRADTPLGATAFLVAAAARAALGAGDRGALLARLAFWSYELIGPRLPAPALTAQWLVTHLFALTRREDVLRAHPEARRRGRLGLGAELFALQLAHPEGVELARLDPATNLATHCRTPDGRVRLAPAPMLAEIARALATPVARDRDYPLILDSGRRTLWNANTIQRDPRWRKGKGPHCTALMHPDDARQAGIDAGASVVLETRRGAVTLPAELDDSVRRGSVHVPNGFGLSYRDGERETPRVEGVAVNELTALDERDPFTGCPHHKAIACRIRPLPAS